MTSVAVELWTLRDSPQVVLAMVFTNEVEMDAHVVVLF